MSKEIYITYEIQQKQYSSDADTGWSEWRVLKSFTIEQLKYFTDPGLKLMSEYSPMALRDNKTNHVVRNGETKTRLVKVVHVVEEVLTPELEIDLKD